MAYGAGRRCRRLGLAVIAAAAAGCAAAMRVDPLTSLPATAEAISFLGDTLWSLRFDIATAQTRLERLQRARQHAAAKPDDLNAALGLVRRTAGMGRFREAIQLANTALDRHPEDPRLYRLRGELLLRTRRLDLAIRDLQAAAHLTISLQAYTKAEFVEIDDEDVVAEGVLGLVGVGVRHFTLLLLGQAYLARGDYRRARASLDESLKAAANADEAAAAAVWLVLADQRAGTEGAAAAVLRTWRADAQVVIRRAEHRLLLAWKGTLSVDSLRTGMRTRRDTEEEALYTFAAGVARMVQGDREEARHLFDLVRVIGDWSSTPFLVAEAELRRMRDAAPRGGA